MLKAIAARKAKIDSKFFFIFLFVIPIAEYNKAINDKIITHILHKSDIYTFANNVIAVDIINSCE